jgi:hypothetical protein
MMSNKRYVHFTVRTGASSNDDAADASYLFNKQGSKRSHRNKLPVYWTELTSHYASILMT